MKQTMLTRADLWPVVSIMARTWDRRPVVRFATDGRDSSLLQVPELLSVLHQPLFHGRRD